MLQLRSLIGGFLRKESSIISRNLAAKSRMEASTPMAEGVSETTGSGVEAIAFSDKKKAWETFKYPPIVEDWWGREWRGRHVTHWIDWAMKRDMRKRICIEKNAPERLHLFALKTNRILPLAFREEVVEELKNMPRDSIPVRARKRCQFTSRKRGGVCKYRASRFIFRDLADHAKLSGVIRACWGRRTRDFDVKWDLKR